MEQGAVIVTGVREGSPAAEAGVRPGDIIRRVNGREIEWHFQFWGIMESGGRTGKPEQFTLALTRNDTSRVGYEGDLAAKIALAADDETLYLAAIVTDDVQSQPFDGWYYWMGDCLQLGLSPTLSGTTAGYTEQDHEIAFTLRDDGRAVAWRYQGRRGQPREEIPSVKLRITREGNRTTYRAGIPIEELQPLAPDLWPKVGVNLVVNDHDGGKEDQRKGRLELREGSMTRGKRTSEFAVFEFEPSPDLEKVSAALLWRRRATPQPVDAGENPVPGFFRLVLAAASPEADTCRVRATLQSLDSPQASPAFGDLQVPLDPEAKEWSLRLATGSPPGRYRLSVRVENDEGREVVTDRLPVFIYPRSEK